MEADRRSENTRRFRADIASHHANSTLSPVAKLAQLRHGYQGALRCEDIGK
jgi:hypothetical protein